MKTKDEDDKTAATLLTWEVAKVPEGEAALKIGSVRAGIGGQVRMTQEHADAMNKALPGCLKLVGI